MRKDIAFTIAGPVATKRHTSPKHHARRRGPKTTNAGGKSSRRRAKRARSAPQARASVSSAHVVHVRHLAKTSRARRLPLNGGPFSFLVRREGRTSMLPLNPAKQGSVVRTSPEIALGMPTDAGRKQFMAPIRQQAGNDPPRSTAGRSIMRRPLVHRVFLRAVPAPGNAGPQKPQLGKGAVELARHVEHRLVLLRHVALKPGEPLLETINAFFGHEVWRALRIARPQAGERRRRRYPRRVFPARAR